MPCNDYPRESSYETQLRNKNNALSDVNQELVKKNHYLESIICALISTLPSFNIDVNHFLTRAEKDGSLQIKEFWKEHQNKDKERILKILKETFSEHEINLLKQIL